jgi:hypothetical protein
METILDDTGFLFATPNFWRGAASAFDIGGTLIEYNTSKDENDADIRALASDWAIVGKDIQNSVESCKKESEKREAQNE